MGRMDEIAQGERLAWCRTLRRHPVWLSLLIVL